MSRYNKNIWIIKSIFNLIKFVTENKLISNKIRKIYYIIQTHGSKIQKYLLEVYFTLNYTIIF